MGPAQRIHLELTKDRCRRTCCTIHRCNTCFTPSPTPHIPTDTLSPRHAHFQFIPLIYLSLHPSIHFLFPSFPLLLHLLSAFLLSYSPFPLFLCSFLNLPIRTLFSSFLPLSIFLRGTLVSFIPSFPSTHFLHLHFLLLPPLPPFLSILLLYTYFFSSFFTHFILFFSFSSSLISSHLSLFPLSLSFHSFFFPSPQVLIAGNS